MSLSYLDLARDLFGDDEEEEQPPNYIALADELFGSEVSPLGEPEAPPRPGGFLTGQASTMGPAEQPGALDLTYEEHAPRPSSPFNPNRLARGAANVVESVGGAMEMMSPGTPQATTGRVIQEGAQSFNKYLDTYIKQPESKLGQMTASAVESLPYMAGAMGVTLPMRFGAVATMRIPAVQSMAKKTAEAVLKRTLDPKAIARGEKAIETATGVLSATFANMFLESGSHYAEAIKGGKTPEEAEAEAHKIAVGNIPTLLTSIAEGVPGIKIATRGAASVLTEALEEGYQGALGEAVGESGELFNADAWGKALTNPQRLEEMAIGATVGGGMATLTGEVGSKAKIQKDLDAEKAQLNRRAQEIADRTKPTEANEPSQTLGDAAAVDQQEMRRLSDLLNATQVPSESRPQILAYAAESIDQYNEIFEKVQQRRRQEIEAAFGHRGDSEPAAAEAAAPTAPEAASAPAVTYKALRQEAQAKGFSRKTFAEWIGEQYPGKGAGELTPDELAMAQKRLYVEPPRQDNQAEVGTAEASTPPSAQVGSDIDREGNIAAARANAERQAQEAREAEEARQLRARYLEEEAARLKAEGPDGDLGSPPAPVAPQEPPTASQTAPVATPVTAPAEELVAPSVEVPTQPPVAQQTRPQRKKKLTLRGVLMENGGIRLSKSMRPEYAQIKSHQRAAYKRVGLISENGTDSDVLVDQLKRDHPELGIETESDLIAALKDPNRINAVVDVEDRIGGMTAERETEERLASGAHNDPAVEQDLWERLDRAQTADDFDAIDGLITTEHEGLRIGAEQAAALREAAARTREEMTADEPFTLFQKSKAEKVGAQLEDDGSLRIDRPEEISKADWSKLNTAMKKAGYNWRGADDARELIMGRLERGEGKLGPVHADAIAALKEILEVGKNADELTASVNLKAAKRRFGTTSNFDEAGYLLSDGSMLDFSGKREGGDPGGRAYDHRNIGAITHDRNDNPIEGVVNEGGYEGMMRFIREGHVRIDGPSGSIHVGKPLTPKQRTVLSRLIRQHNGEVYVDVDNGQEDAREPFAERYPAGTPAARILADIDRAVRGEAPRDLGVQRFRQDDATGEGPSPRASKAAQEMLKRGIRAEAQARGISEEEAASRLRGILRGDETPEEIETKLRQNAPAIFASEVKKVVQTKMPGRMRAADVGKMIRKQQGVKEEELEWLGLDEWLEGKKTVTKAEVEEFIAQNEVVVEEVLDRADSDARQEEKRLEREVKALKSQIPGGYGGTHSGTLLETIEAEKRILKDYEQEVRDNKRSNESFEHYAGEARQRLADLEKAFQIRQEVEHLENKAADLNVRPKSEYGDLTLPGGENYSELLLTLPSRPGSEDYKTGHFMDVKNVLAHIRFDERTDADGNRVLFINEIQSDWHQGGRKEGYQKRGPDVRIDEEMVAVRREEFGVYEVSTVDGVFVSNIMFPSAQTPEAAIDEARRRLREDPQQVGKLEGVPDAPFKNSWRDLAIKRMLRYATDNGFDSIAWPGSAEQVEKIEQWPEGSADQHQGVVSFYTDFIPGFLNKYAKKWGGRVGKADFIGPEPKKRNLQIANGGEAHGIQWWNVVAVDENDVGSTIRRFPKREEAEAYITELETRPVEARQVNALPITDQMRQSLGSEAQRLFQLRAAPSESAPLSVREKKDPKPGKGFKGSGKNGKVRVVSLFDGLGGARIALENLGFDVEYAASEVDKFAIKVQKKNFPETQEIGDVTQVKGEDLGEVDILCGGSPCQDLSIAKAGRQSLQGKKSKLFYEYVRILKETKPKYFIFENVNRMKPEVRDEITRLLGVEPVVMDAGKVSAQRRERIFWTNIHHGQLVDDPAAPNLADVLEQNADPAFDLSEGELAYMDRKTSSRGRDHWAFGHHSDASKPRSSTLTANLSKGVPYNVVIDGSGRRRKFTPTEAERLAGVPEGYTEGVSKTQRYKMLGNGFQVKVMEHILRGMVTSEKMRQQYQDRHAARLKAERKAQQKEVATLRNRSKAKALVYRLFDLNPERGHPDGGIPMKPTPSKVPEVLERIDKIHAEFPNPLESADTFKRFWGRVKAGNTTMLKPPPRGVELATSAQRVKGVIERLNPRQRADAQGGLKEADLVRQDYANGAVTPLDTGLYYFWGSLSKQLSPYPHESAFMDALIDGGVEKHIQAAIDGTFDLAAYKKFAKKVIPKGSPGSGAQSNLNMFGDAFLQRGNQRLTDGPHAGKTRLQAWHDVMADPSLTGPQKRRMYHELMPNSGIQNKVVSFVLLVTGHKDVLIIDRVQFRHLWDAVNRADEYGTQQIYSADVANMFNNYDGLALYEGLERGLTPAIQQAYADMGRPVDGNIGTFHWESWVLESNQEVGHSSTEAIGRRRREGIPMDEALEGMGVREGKFDTFQYGVKYARIGGENKYVYTTQDGTEYPLTKQQHDAFQKRVKNPKEGVVPRGFKVSEDYRQGRSEDEDGFPWYEHPDVDRNAYDELVRSVAGQGAVSAAGAAGAPDGPGQRLNQRSLTEPSPRGQIDVYANDETVIRLFANADETTLPHELIHHFAYGLTKEQLAPINRWLGAAEGATPRQWTVEQHEKLAEAGTDFLFSDRPTTDQTLRDFYQRFKDWVRQLYDHFRGRDADPRDEFKFSRESQRVFEGMFGGGQSVRELQQGFRGEADVSTTPDIGTGADGRVGASEQPLRTAAQSGNLPLGDPQRDRNFKRWFGKSKVVDAEGKPLRVYHGTGADFDTFREGSPDAFMGPGFYFTDAPSEASSNYASAEGPDVSQKIAERYDELSDEYYEEHDEYPAEHGDKERDPLWVQARDEIMGQPNVMPTYLAIENPVIVGGNPYGDIEQTTFTWEEAYDETTDEYGEPSGTFVDLIEAADAVLADGGYPAIYRASGQDTDNPFRDQIEHVIDNEGIDAETLIDNLRNYDIENNEGEGATMAFVAEVFQRAGYDGIIMDADRANKKHWRNMPGVEPGSKHYIAFHPEQVKSATGNRGTFDPDDPNILHQKGKDPDPLKMSLDEWLDAKFDPARAASTPSRPDGAQTPPAASAPKGATPQPGQKERGLSKSLEAAGRPKGNLYYDPITNEETEAKARARVAKDLGAARDFAMNDTAKPGAEHTATGLAAMAAYEKQAADLREQGKDEEAARALENAYSMASQLAERLTQAGQEVQAARLLTRLSPEGVLYFAQKRIDEINKKQQRGTKTGILAKPKLSLSEEEYQKLRKLALQAQEWDDLGAQASGLSKILSRFWKGGLKPEDVAQIKGFGQELDRIIGTFEEDAAAEAPIKKKAAPKGVPTGAEGSALRERLQKMEEGAKRRLREKGLHIQSGIPVDQLADFAILGASKMAQVGLNYKDWTAAMLSDLGETYSPHMRQIYGAALRSFRAEKAANRKRLQQAKAVRDLITRVEQDPQLADMPDYAALADATAKLKELTGDAQRDLAAEIQGTLAALEPVTMGQRVATVRYMAMLLNPKTIARNVVGNEAFWRVERLAKVLATGIDYTVTLGGKRTPRRVTFGTGRPFGQASLDFGKGMAIGGKAAIGGYNPDGIQTQYELKGQVFKGKLNPLNYLEKGMGIALRGFDYAAYNRAYQTHLHEQATLAWMAAGKPKDRAAFMKNHIANLDALAVEAARDYGKYVTFQDDTKLSKAAVGVKRWLNFDKDFGFGDLLMPFPKTPSNLAMRAFDYSPAGFVRSALIASRPFLAGRTQAEIKPPDPAEAEMALARAILGTGLTGFAWWLAEQGALWGEGEDESNKAKAIRRDQTGERWFQINGSGLARWFANGMKDHNLLGKRRGDTFYSYDWAQPLAIQVAMGARASEAARARVKKSEKVQSAEGYALTALQTVGAGALGAISALEEQPMLQAFADVFRYSDSASEGAMRVAEGALSSFVPTLANQIQQIRDNRGRELHDPGVFNRALNKAIYRMPFLSEGLPVAYKTLGADVPRERYQNGSNTLFNVFLNPAFEATYNPDPLATTLIGLYEETGKTDHLPRKQGVKMRVDGRDYALTGADLAEVQRKMAGFTTRNMAAIVKQRTFDRKSPDDQVKALSKAVNAAADSTRDWFRKNRLPTYQR